MTSATGPDWTAVTSAVATAVGAGAAVTAVFVAALPYRRDVAQRVREHASHISCWLGPSPFQASIRNTSTEAAYDVSLRFLDGVGSHIVDAIDELPVLPPAETVEIFSADTRAVQDAHASKRQVVVEATFTDRNGVRWTRKSDGQLRQHGES